MAEKKPPARLRALAVAQKEVGVKESPPNSNSGPRVRQYQAATSLGGTGWPWCMAFVCWCYKQVGKPLTYNTASVGMFQTWASKNGDIVYRPFRGDIICYNFTVDNWPDHVGIVERVLGLPRGNKAWYVRAIEGNTSAGNDANGGQVQRRWRSVPRSTFVRIKG